MQGENNVPLHKGHTHSVISTNVKELMRSGYKPKQSIAIALANARKYRKMADGGQVVADGGMGDIPGYEAPMGGDDESLSKMDRKGPEDYQRDHYTLDKEANYYPSEVANPNEMDEDQMFAQALKKKGMKQASPENPTGFAMGGLVQGDTEEDFPVGARPEPKMGPREEDEHTGSTVGDPFMENPSGAGMSKEAMAALKKKKMMDGWYKAKR
jgi:hypothetical protein